VLNVRDVREVSVKTRYLCVAGRPWSDIRARSDRSFAHSLRRVAPPTAPPASGVSTRRRFRRAGRRTWPHGLPPPGHAANGRL